LCECGASEGVYEEGVSQTMCISLRDSKTGNPVTQFHKTTFFSVLKWQESCDSSNVNKLKQLVL